LLPGGGTNTNPFPDYPENRSERDVGRQPQWREHQRRCARVLDAAQRTLTFNAKVPWFFGISNDPAVGPNQFDFWAVAMHEWGHVLGLDHPDAAVQFTTMYPSIGQRGTMNGAQLTMSRSIDADTLDWCAWVVHNPRAGRRRGAGDGGLLAARRKRG